MAMSPASIADAPRGANRRSGHVGSEESHGVPVTVHWNRGIRQFLLHPRPVFTERLSSARHDPLGLGWSRRYGTRLRQSEKRFSRRRGVSLSLKIGLFPPTAGHLYPVQFLFQLMERIVADLVAFAHAEDGVSRALERPAVNVAVGEAPGFAFIRVRIRSAQMRGEFLPDRLRDW